MVEVSGNGTEDVVSKKPNRKRKRARPLVAKQNKKSCCGKKKCACNPKKKKKIAPCSQFPQPKLVKQTCVCGKIDCDCYGLPTSRPFRIPKYVEILKCGYPGDEPKPICVCGKTDCTCYDRKIHRNSGIEAKQACICGKPYCSCGKSRLEYEDIPDIQYTDIETCNTVAPVKNYCVCGKPDCTCYQDIKIVDDDRECSYRVPVLRPLCICRKVDCDCNIDRYGENKIQKKIETPAGAARCICGKIFCDCNIGRANVSPKESVEGPEEQVKIEFEKSAYVKEREQLIRSFEIPSLTDAKKTLGQLAGFVYEQCESGLRSYIPQEPVLGYGDLWVSPSDLLIPHVCLKPPLTRKYMQALTHEGILEIGHHIELKFINQMEIEKEEALEAQKQELTKKFQDSIKHTIKEAEVREKAACRREMEKMAEEFELKLKEEISAMQSRLEEEYLELSKVQDEKLTLKWEQKLKLEVQETTKNITKKFLAELDRQEKILTLQFKSELRKKDIQRDFERGKLCLDHKKEMQILQHRLECENIASMMYILVMERRQCADKKNDIEDYYKNQLRKLTNRVNKNEQMVQELKNEVQQQMKNVQLRETCVLEILKQYQKFINFALKAAPTQAEFLLSIEKLMLFELTDALLKMKPVKRKGTYAMDTLPWMEMSHSEEMEHFNVKHGLEVKDYHDCVHEHAIPKAKEDMVLPAFVFKDKLYVREDFRNMLSLGIKPTSSHDLWNEDVDALMGQLRQSVSSDEVNLKNNSSTEIQKKILLRKSSIDKTSIQFKLDGHPQPAIESGKVTPDDVHSLKESVDTKNSLRYTEPIINNIDYSKIGEVEDSKILLATKSSLELMYEKFSQRRSKQKSIPVVLDPEKTMEQPEEYENLPNGEVASVEKLDLIYKSTETLKTSNGDAGQIRISKELSRSERYLSVDTRDSLILRQASLAKATKSFSLTPKDSIEIKKESDLNASLRQKSSKLATAKDSVVMLRKSRSLLKEPAVCTVCHKKESIKEKEPVPRECDKCTKNKESLEILSGGVLPKKSKVDEHDKQIKLSHVEVIEVDNLVSNVSFQNEPSRIEPEEISNKLSRLYKPPKRKVPVKKKSTEDRCVKQKFVPTAQIVGERDCKEFLQNEEEFTIDRMRSFITLISDHPNLIKMFTACQR